MVSRASLPDGARVHFEPSLVPGRSVPHSVGEYAKTFKDVLAGSDVPGSSSLNLFRSSHKGTPSVFISDEDDAVLAEPFSFSLVGKFSLKRPNMDRIREFFSFS